MNIFKRIKAWWEDRKDPFGKYAHDKYYKHKLSHGFGACLGRCGHYCYEWDGLYICIHCDEFDCCSCYHLTKDEPNNIILSEN